MREEGNEGERGRVGEGVRERGRECGSASDSSLITHHSSLTQDPAPRTQDPAHHPSLITHHSTQSSIELPGSVDVAGSVEMFRRHGDDLVDRWDGTYLVRTVPVNGRAVPYACSVAGDIDRPTLRVVVEEEQHREAVEAALRSVFVQPAMDFPALLSTDPAVARLNDLFPGIRPVLQHDLLSALVRCISAQQVKAW